MAEGWIEPFDRVSIHKDENEYAVIRLRLAKMKKKDREAVNVKLEDKLLKILVELEGTKYGFDFTVDGEIDREIKKEVDNGYVDVTIKKKKPFSLRSDAFS